MHGYEQSAFEGVELSVAFTGDIDGQLCDLLDKGGGQEDLTFAYWMPSRGARRYTAIIQQVLPPQDGERILVGNASFTGEYLARVLRERPKGAGVAFLHSHLGPGWQGMSIDDELAERDRLAGVAASSTGFPLVGLTRGSDGAWSARFWLRAEKHKYERADAASVRVVGHRLHAHYHPHLRPAPQTRSAQAATISVWGERGHQDVIRTRVGIIGLGSVGSVVAEALSRIGIQQLTLIDFDVIEERNLDRTLGAFREDIGLPKVRVSHRLVKRSHTSETLDVSAVDSSITDSDGIERALDCDVIISCVDRPWPRHLLNTLAYAHLIPVIDGGILARVSESGALVHIGWRIHTVGPARACLYCLGALRRSDVALDRDGKLDNPDYIKGLSLADRERYGRRNVFAFSLSVASHEVLQLVGLITGSSRIGGSGPQTYHAYPGVMEVGESTSCAEDCDVTPLTASAGAILGPA